MKVHRNLNNISINKPVITIGIFDGVHTGHHVIIDQLKKTAVSVNGDSVIFTLWPHPRIVLDSFDNRIGLLNTMDEKILLLEEAGIDHLVIHPFDKSFARIPACDFIENVLVKKIGISNLIIGFNHQFGHQRKGDFTEYENYALRFGFKIEKVGSKEIDGINISSTRIRKGLHEGNIELANRYLGYNYQIQGKVIHGSGIGRRIEYPTANIDIIDKNKLIPADGVYAVKVNYNGKNYSSMLNIGKRPTMGNNNKRTIEVNIFDFKKDIYDENITIQFYSRIRDEIKFDCPEKLKLRLEQDKIEAVKILSGHK